MRNLFLATVDCDHVAHSSIALRQETLEALLGVFADVGAAGHATWFLNETYNNYCTTGNHPDVVHEALRRGDTVGIHDHIDKLDGEWGLEPILELCTAAKDSALTWLRANGYPNELRAHRFGCLFQRVAAYEAIGRLGYSLVTDIYPGDKSLNHTGHPSYDNLDIPIGIAPYRHDAHNFTDHTSRSGRFLQFPVTQMYFARVTFEQVERCIAAAEARGQPIAALVLCFHPYELLTEGRDALSRERVDSLRTLFEGMVTEFGVAFASIEECAAEWEGASD